jgi:FKBP-type peptidyl-prolyl cis-trans isomerase 2
VGSSVKTKDGHVARIVDLSDSSAVLDFNHPLAGKNLVFEVTILKVEKQP